ncbi:non-ribosomal peptide synthetase [Trinickia sp. NRRL B-1857]|uniref:non-ribosomal peptide synthetase n=1 Tax=Trinickia sp. NRRL B-1857 TaxID=3162879 RepID=UPI003D2E8AF5
MTNIPSHAGPASIGTRFLLTAKRFADRIAIRERDADISYRVLLDRVLRLAGGLDAMGVKRGTPVLVCTSTPTDGVIAILATLFVGAIYVPVDDSQPPERVASIVADVGAKAAIIDGDCGAAYTAVLNEVRIPIGQYAKLIEARPLDTRKVHADGASIASILYTSGSTGQPKGVAQIHRNVLHHVDVLTRRFSIDHEDRQTLLSSLAFDGSTTDLYCAILNGATLLPFSFRREGAEALLSFLEETEATLLHSTPTLFRALVGRHVARVLPHLRVIILGGEPVFHSDRLSAQSLCPPGAWFVNGYGATETSGFVAMHALTVGAPEPTEEMNRILPIGRAVEGFELFFLDDQGRTNLEQGELQVRSPYIALGYWRGRQFGAPLSGDGDMPPGDTRVYATGDWGQADAGGEITLQGRRDRQEKVRGYRVNLAEIEMVASMHDDVRQAVARAFDDPRSLTREIALYVVPVDGRSIQPDAMRQRLRRHLPPYLQPVHIEIVDTLPLLTTGKTDLRALSMPVAVKTRHDVDANGNLVDRISAIWREVLGVPDIDVDRNFFDIGGSSILLARVHVQLQETTGIRVPLFRLFEYPTVSRFAAFLSTRQG